MPPAMAADTAIAIPVARVNGVPLNTREEVLDAGELRRRACTELLRQEAQRAGLLSASDPAAVGGAIGEAAASAIEALLERNIAIGKPSTQDCRRYYSAHVSGYRTGERVRVRHILFAVTPRVDVTALRKRAEAVLVEVRCHDGRAGGPFGAAARESSNCPSGAEGGELGWLRAEDCAPELAREVFGHVEVGVLPRLVHSRFGLHVVEVLEREPGTVQPFESVRGAVASSLRQRAYVTAVRRYLQVLAGQAELEGVDPEAASVR